LVTNSARRNRHLPETNFGARRTLAKAGQLASSHAGDRRQAGSDRRAGAMIDVL
jgi:hypothetical protein